MFREYHSFRNAGTEKTPQCRKMPNRASWYQRGGSYPWSDSHVASYGPRAMPSLTRASSASLFDPATGDGSDAGSSGDGISDMLLLRRHSAHHSTAKARAPG